MMLHFADRRLLLVLGLLYLVWVATWVGLSWWHRRHRGEGAVRFSSLARFRRLRSSRSLVLRRLVQGLRLATVALLVIAMGRPQSGKKHSKVRTEGVDIVLAIDTSGSMRALDLDADRRIDDRRNRLEVAKDVVEAFVAGRENDQVGLVVFGAQAFTQCPLTLDHGIVSTFLGELEIGMAGDLTAVGDALGTAVKRLRDSEAESKVAIVLTDGRNNAGLVTPEQATEIARTLDVKVYTIGVGTRGEAPFIVQTPLGPDVQFENVEIDEAMLTTMAESTGGAYFRAEDSATLAAIYEQIDQLEKTEITMESYLEYEEEFGWLVMPAIGILLLEIVLLGTRFRKLP